MLRARLAEIKEREHLEKISDIKGVQQKIEWGSQIRSYVFMPYTLAKDHRTGYEFYSSVHLCCARQSRFHQHLRAGQAQ